MSHVVQNKLTGRCLCGSVEFTVQDQFSEFYLCHCIQCRRVTGSVYAANIFTRPDNIKWLKGREYLVRYDDPERDFSKVFCTKCGSGLPFVTKGGRHLIVPAGSLTEQPAIKPQGNIFWAEHVPWYEEGVNAGKFDGFLE